MSFSINEAFKFSFQAFKENWAKILSISLFSIVLMSIALYFMSKYLLIHFDVLSLVTIPEDMVQFVFFKNISLLMPTIFLFCVTSTILPIFYGLKAQFKNYFLDAEKVPWLGCPTSPCTSAHLFPSTAPINRRGS